jgi:hypothetical protein
VWANIVLIESEWKIEVVQLLECAGSCKHKSAYGAVFIRALQSAWHLIAAALSVAVLEQLFCFDDLNHFVRNEIPGQNVTKTQCGKVVGRYLIDRPAATYRRTCRLASTHNANNEQQATQLQNIN